MKVILVAPFLFSCSRFLRIYIPYLTVLIASAILFYWQDIPILIFSSHNPLTDLLSFITNTFIIGQDLLWLLGENQGEIVYSPIRVPGYEGRSYNYLAIISPGFSIALLLYCFIALLLYCFIALLLYCFIALLLYCFIALEMYFYLLAPFIVRNLSRIKVGLFLACLYHIGLFFLNTKTIDFTYHNPLSSFIYFFSGAYAYHLSKLQNLPQKVSLSDWVILGTLTSTSITGILIIPPALLPLSLFFIPSLFHFTKHIKVDRFIGNLSYGVYLTHMPILMIARISTLTDGFNLFLLVSAISILCSIGILLIIELPLEKIRHKFRDNITKNTNKLSSTKHKKTIPTTEQKSKYSTV